MPDLYSAPLPLSFHLAGALAATGAGVAAGNIRKVIPFPYQIIGAVASVNTAPTGANLIFDVLVAPHGTAPGSANFKSIWAINNGTNGNPDHRPTIVAGAFDMAPVAASTYTVAPQGTDPTLQSGQQASTTYNTPDTLPFLARPDANQTSSMGFGAAAGGNVGEPFNMGQSGAPVNLEGTSNTTANIESGGPGQAPEAANATYTGSPGDVVVVQVVQVGSTVAGSDAELTLFLAQA